jgi:hypothetical protein
MKVDRSDCAELGLDEAGDRESLSHRLMKDVFIRRGGDCKGDMVSLRSSDSELRSLLEGPVTGENKGKGIATDDSVGFVELLSEDDTLPTVCRLRGTTDLPLLG